MINSSAMQPLLIDQQLDRPFIVAGDRAYLIGCQDGTFPDLGRHIPGEMGGIWAHPIKLLDGFWLRVADTWLTGASRFRIGSYCVEHEYELEGLRIVRCELVPDGEPAVIVRYTFTASVTKVIPIRFLARTDIRGVWSPSATQPETRPDQARFESDSGTWSCRDTTEEWYVRLGARGVQPSGNASGYELWGPEITSGKGISVALDYEMEVMQDKTAELEFIIAGSREGAEPARASYRRVTESLPDLARSKDDRFTTLLSYSDLEIPDTSIVRAWDWVKCDFDWLVRAVPGWGRGLGAGVEEYPWWFGCDNGYALRGCLALGQHEVAIDTLHLIRRLSLAANGESGRVIHEANTWGTTTNPGNAQETPHYLRTVWDAFLWTGDVSFLAQIYPFCKQGLLTWTLGELCRDGDPFPYGYGIMEMSGLDLQCIDTASLTVEALEALAGMADVLGEPEVAVRCRELHGMARSHLEEAFWMESEGLYGDMLATPAEMAPRLEAWMDQAARNNTDAARSFRQLLLEAKAAPDQDRKRPWSLKNWSVLCPLEAGSVETERAIRTLDRAEGPEFTGPWGVYICGTDRTAMMSISTGVMAAAETAYGRGERALSYVRMLTDTLDMHMPGGISEMSPDYGCFVQAWSGYAIAWPLVAGIFGVTPNAHQRCVNLTPSFPPGWSQARLSNVRVGTNTLDLRWDGSTLWVTSYEPGWSITCDSVPVRAEQSSAPLVHGGERE